MNVIEKIEHSRAPQKEEQQHGKQQQKIFFVC